jgi:predicted lipoprotein with Yx(FWY)xxD motif
MDPGGNAIEQRPTLGVSETDFGDVLVGDNGMTVYMFMPDQQENGTPTCYDDCEQAWPVVEATDSPIAGGGVDESLIGSVERDDGTQQLTYNDLPLYYFSGDKKVGQANGQGIEEVWWVMDAEGQPVEQAPQG